MITIQLGEGHQHKAMSDRVSYIEKTLKRPGKNGRNSKIRTVYIGFDSYAEAMGFAKQLRKCHSRIVVRESERSFDWRYEVKIQGDFTLADIEAIAIAADEKKWLLSRLQSDRLATPTLRDFYTKEQWRRRALIC